jgi:pimeloyl-ACP methyl ester carboxylesterase
VSIDLEQGPGAGRLNIILVHGVWADGSCWSEVFPTLAHAGHRVYSAQLPLTSFDNDQAALERLLDRVSGPTVLVGHSYGGAVITAAGAHEKVRKLIYLAAFAPEKGERLGSILGIHPPKAQVEMGPDQHGFVWATPAVFADAVGHDLPKDTLDFLVAVQKPYSYRLFNAALSSPAWHTKPTSYLVASEDRILNPQTQRMLAQRIGAELVAEVESSHMVLSAAPYEVSQFILQAVAKL